MRIDELRLKNFRCFEAFRITLHPSMTVLVGVNGSGKSAVLVALAAALQRRLVLFTSGSLLSDSDHRLVTVQTGNLLSIEKAGTLEIEVRGQVAGQQQQWGTGDGFSMVAGFVQSLVEAIEQASTATPGKAAQSDNFPVFKLFGTNRLWTHGDLSGSFDGPGSRTIAWSRCLEPGADARPLQSWLRHLEQVRLQKIAEDLEAGRPPTLPELPELEAVNRAVTTCIEGAKRVFFSVKHGELRVEMRDGTLLPFSLLSDGYRNFLGMVADIAWRCVQLNPHLGGDAPLKTDGVVLIDEVDLHLHPGWQRKVLHDLQAAFPKVQFVVTTHSPQVLSTAKREWVRVLVPDEKEARDAGYVEGRDSNAILEDIFGVPARPQGALEEVEALFREIDEERYEDARARLLTLQGQMGPDDPDLVRARWMIEREEG